MSFLKSNEYFLFRILENTFWTISCTKFKFTRKVHLEQNLTLPKASNNNTYLMIVLGKIILSP